MKARGGGETELNPIGLIRALDVQLPGAEPGGFLRRWNVARGKNALS